MRTVFVSDVHLGTRDCRADLLLDFLHRVQPRKLILVGDIIDLWQMKRSRYWPDSHTQVLRKLMALSTEGTELIFIPGNHDEALRGFCGMDFGRMELQREYVHETARGKRLLVLHGDEFDSAVKCSRWLSALGCFAYDVLLWSNRAVNAWRRRFGHPYWSLAGWLKSRVGTASQYIEQFERAALHAAQRRGLDGVVCGHIHRAALVERDGLLYCNDGDWVDSCSALIEDQSGELALWHWQEQRAGRAAAGPRVLPLGRAA
ncbi:MAG: UDP-2,3-diacylglucosamine diphosphatase [Steroidobacteraceae bacterium]